VVDADQARHHAGSYRPGKPASRGRAPSTRALAIPGGLVIDPL
jgi:hypothetical protein